MVGEPNLNQLTGALNNNSQWSVNAHRVTQVDENGNLINKDNPLPITKGFYIPIYDDITLTYIISGNGVGEIETVVYKYQTVTVTTLTLNYDSNNKLISVVLS